MKRKRGKTKGSKISPTRGAQLKVFWFLPEMTIKPSKTISSLRPGYLNLLKPSYRPKSQPPLSILPTFCQPLNSSFDVVDVIDVVGKLESWKAHLISLKTPFSEMSLTTLVDIFGQFSGGANLP